MAFCLPDPFPEQRESMMVVSMRLAMAVALLCLVPSLPAHGQPVPVDTLREARGGVHIRIRRNSRPRYVILRRPTAIRPAAPGVPPSGGTPSPGLGAADLAGMEARLAAHIDRRVAELLAAQRRPAPVTPAPVSQPPVTPPPSVTPVAPPPADAVTPTVEYIERAIVEQGLFRSVHVNFEVNRSTLLGSSRGILNAIGEVMGRHPELRLEIGGHTDSTGPEEYNQRLSEARAEAVRTYLLEHFPIAPDRLVARGYGESQPLAGNATATERTLNRRVEFRVLTP